MAAQAAPATQIATIRLNDFYCNEHRVQVTEEDTLYTLLQKADGAYKRTLAKTFISLPPAGEGMFWGLIDTAKGTCHIHLDHGFCHAKPELMKTLGVTQASKIETVSLDIIKKTKLSTVGLLDFAHLLLLNVMFRVDNAQDSDDGKK